MVLVEGTIAEDTPGRGCPGEDVKIMRCRRYTRKPSSETVSDDDSRSPCGGGALPPPVVAGGLLPVDVTDAPALSVRDLNRFPRGFRWCGSMGS